MKTPYERPLAEVVQLTAPTVLQAGSPFGTSTPGAWESISDPDLDILSFLTSGNPMSLL